MRPLRTWLAFIAAMWLVCAGSWGADARALSEWLRKQVSASGLIDDLALSALRELRDPRLRPLFAAQATGENPGRRLIGILALAEIEQPPRLDLLLLKNATSELERLEIVRQAAERGLLHADDERALREGAANGNALQAWAMLRAASQGNPINAAAAEQLASDGAASIAGVGALLLLECGQREKAEARLATILADRSEAGRARVADLIRTAARHSLKSAAPFCEKALDANTSDDALAAEAIGALLALKPDRGIKEWTRRYDGVKGDLAGRIRLGLIALERSDVPHEPVWKRLTGAKDSGLLRAMGEVVRTRGTNAMGPALGALARERHAPSLAWLLYAAERADGGAWTEALEAVASFESGAERVSASMLEMSVRAAALLFERAPERARALLDAASIASESRRIQILLLGALRARSGSAGIGERATGWPDAECEALATILRARDAETPDSALADRLERIAFGWGGTSRGRRVQAAWLGLVHLGRERAALAEALTRE